MSRLALLLGASLLVIACAGAPPGTPTNAPASVTPTFAPPSIVTPTATAPAVATDAQSAPPVNGGVGSVGEKIEVSGYQFITLAESEYSTSGYSEFFEPDEGKVIYAFLFEFEGLDPAGSSFNPLYFDLNVDDFEYNTSILGGKEPALGSGKLQPGRTVRGWISFEAPLANEVILKYEPVLGLAGNAVEWIVEVIQ